MEAVIFIGIQGTGKSTFYQERFANTHIRLNLDMLHTRRREGILLRACLEAQQSFVVDNTNILEVERARYIQLAKPAGFQITGYYFHSNLADALSRNRQRTGRSVIPDKGVIAKYRRMQRPHYAEGFNRLYFVTIEPDGAFRVEDWQEEAAAIGRPEAAHPAENTEQDRV